MFKVLILIIITSIILFVSCDKSSNTKPLIQHKNCANLITDTAGTGDTARIYLADAFTPNHDGLNDSCRPHTYGITSLQFTILDGNNNVVFSSNQLNKGWAPATPPATYATYYYSIQATTTTNHQIGMCGIVYSLSCFPEKIPVDSFYFDSQLTPKGFDKSIPSIEPLGQCP